jgi:hypothetical protein
MLFLRETPKGARAGARDNPVLPTLAIGPGSGTNARDAHLWEDRILNRQVIFNLRLF